MQPEHRRTVLYFIILALLPFRLLAQSDGGRVSGTLTDNQGHAVAYADVVIRGEDGALLKGTVSDTLGHFVLAGVRGRLLIQASMTGYQTLTISSTPCDLGVLVMEDDLQMLDAATVRSQRTVEKAGQYLVVPDRADVLSSPKSIDLLAKQQLPGLRVDRALGTISIDGGTAIIKVNGKEVTSYRFNNLDPEKIKRIEFSNTPGPRYLDRGASGVINIVLKESDDGGSIMADASQALSTGFTDGYFNTSYHKGKSEFAVEYSLSHRNYARDPYRMTGSYISNERTVERDEEGNGPFHYTFHNITAEYTRQHDDSTMFIASLRNQIYYDHRNGEATMMQIDRDIPSTLKKTRLQEGNQNQPTLDLFFTHAMRGNTKVELNVVGEYASNQEKSDISYDDGTGIRSYPVEVVNRGWDLSAEGVFSKSFKTVSTRFGVQYQHNSATNDYTVSEVVSRMSKDNTYVFAQAEGGIGKSVNWSLGTGAKIFAVKDNGDSRTYIRNLSTGRLGWRISDVWSLSGEMRYIPVLPSLSQLSPVFQRTDDVEAAMGNQGLKPSQFLGSRIIMRMNTKDGWFVNLTGGYDHNFGAIVDAYSYDPGSGLFVTSPVNSDYTASLYTYAEAGVKNLFDHINLSLDWKLKDMRTSGKGFSHQCTNSSSNISVQGVWENFVAGCWFNIKPEWTLSGEIMQQSERGQSIYIQYRWKDLTASATWHCPFNKNGYDYRTKGLSEMHPFEHVNHTVENGNMVVLGLTWRMNYGSSFKKGSKTLSNGGYDSGTVK